MHIKYTGTSSPSKLRRSVSITSDTLQKFYRKILQKEITVTETINSSSSTSDVSIINVPSLH